LVVTVVTVVIAEEDNNDVFVLFMDAPLNYLVMTPFLNQRKVSVRGF